MKKVIIFGTFDYLHAGHKNFIAQARTLGDYVIAVISRDKTTKKVKGKLPDNPEKIRLANLKKTKWVDEAILGDLEDKYKIIKKIKPNIIALGYDQFVFTQKLQQIIVQNKYSTEIIRLKPYHPEIYKSSLIKDGISKKESKKSDKK